MRMAKLWLLLIVVLSPFLLSAESIISNISELEVPISTSPTLLVDERYKNKDYDREAEEYRKLMSRKGYDPMLHRHLAGSYMRMGLYKDAVREARTYLDKTGGKNLNTIWLLSHLSNRMGDYKKALEYTELIRSQRGLLYAPDYVERAISYASTGQLHKAIDAYESAMKAHGSDADLQIIIRSALAYLYMMGGNYAHAKEEVRQALKISEDLSAPYTKMGLIYYYEGDLKEAEEYLKLAKGKKYVDSLEASLTLYQIYKEKNDSESTMAVLARLKSQVQDAIKKNRREDGKTHGLMAYICIEEKDFESARSYALKALEFNPNYMSNLIMGYYYFKMRDYKKARGFLEKSRRLNPIYPVAYEYLSKIHRLEGRFDAAQKEADAALKINPYNRFILAEVEKIKNRQRED